MKLNYNGKCGKGCNRWFYYNDARNKGFVDKPGFENLDGSVAFVHLLTNIVNAKIYGYQYHDEDGTLNNIRGEDIDLKIMKTEEDAWAIDEFREQPAEVALMSVMKLLDSFNFGSETPDERRLRHRRRLSPIPQPGDSPAIRVLRRRRLKPENRPIHRLLREIRKANGLSPEPPELFELE